ncbi:MAG: TraB/GumN family protein [Panacagrimonas sp.]
MRVLLALCLALVSSLSSAADAPFLWKIKGAKATHYLMGSVHLLPRSVYPLPEALDQAYRETDALVLETDPDAVAASDMQKRMLAAAASTNGLRKEIDSKLYAQLRIHALARSLPVDLCDRYRAWFCALSLSMIEFQRAGMEAELGLDRHFYQRAVADTRPMSWLEKPEAQFELFTGMDAEMAREFLQSALEDLERPELRPEALVQMWRRNEVATMARLIAQTAKESPRFHARLLDDRNAAWVEGLVRRFEYDAGQLVIVGAAHLVGPGGLVERLKARGFEIRAVASEDR